MASLFDLADSLINDEYAEFSRQASPYEWQLDLNEYQDYSFKVGFQTISRNEEKYLLFISQLNSQVRPPANSILQAYFQFRDWDLQSVEGIPSWANFVCN